MTPPGEWRCRAADVGRGRTAKFRLTCGTRVVDGFLVHHDGGFQAFLNRCPHAGTPLDLWPNEFLAEDGRTLVCATHGARFEPAGGRCLAGPCRGDALTRLPLRREGDELVVSCPRP